MASKKDKQEEQKPKTGNSTKDETISSAKEKIKEIDSSKLEDTGKEIKTKISFKNPDFIKNQVKKQTGEQEKEKEEEKKEQTKEEKAEAKISSIEDGKNFAFDYEDFEVFAEVLIDIFDTAIISGLRWFAKDESDSPYQIPEKKKTRLVRQLARILYKRQSKLSLEALFVIMLVMAYWTPARKAYTHRKQVLKNIKEDETRQEEKSDKRETVAKRYERAKKKGDVVDVSYEETKTTTVTTKDKKRDPRPRKKQGRPRK